MAFDGITVAAVAKELKEKLSGGRIAKIAQPEPDALLLTVKTQEGQYRLLLSADASLPLAYLCSYNKPGPQTAPGFCMLLRKHLSNARILDISQPGLERILHIRLEHYDEMGDLRTKTLIVEIMGKHSNIILTDEEARIVDAIKRVSSMVSSVREVLPGREYFVAGGGEKLDPLTAGEEDFLKTGPNKDVASALLGTYTGISPAMAAEMVRLSGIEERMDRASLCEDAGAKAALFSVFSEIMDRVRTGRFSPCIYYDEKGEVADFSAIATGMHENARSFDSMSALLEQYYAEKEAVVRIRQRSADLRRIVSTALERNVKKLTLQEKQLKDTESREKLRLFGELLQAYAYLIPAGAKEYEALNYYDNTTVRIPLDPEKSAQENSVRYFERYRKQKRTFEALNVQLEATRSELERLESIQVALDIARKEEDLKQIRQELADYGYIRKKSGAKREKIQSRPLHFVTEDGFHIYVGKNNYQNEEVSFKLANGGDWWFHAKKIPGSHVVVKTEGKELPDKVFEQAAALAAWYSGASGQDKAEVDYLRRRDLKKPAGSAPGFVVYYTNYSMAVRPGIVDLKQEEG